MMRAACRGSLARIAITMAMCIVVASLQGQTRRPPIISSTDLLILRSGKTVTGQIKVCDVDSCRLGSTSYMRDEISWIGLMPTGPTPPSVSDVSEDEVHLQDLSIHKGHLIGISLGLVEIQTGSWERSEVGWIHLAGAPAAPPASGGAISGQDATPPKSSGTSGDPGTSGGSGQGKSGGDKAGAGDQGKGDPPPPPRSSSHGKRGGLWSGEVHIHFRLTDDRGGFTDEKTDVTPRLREFRYPLLRPSDGKTYGTVVHLEPEGTDIRTKHESDTPGQFGGAHCHGSGSVTQTEDDAQASQGAVIWISNVATDTTPLLGFPIVRGTPLYSVSFSLPSAKFTVDCLAWRINAGIREEFPSSSQESFYLAGFGGSPLGCPAFLKTVCDPQIRTIKGENGRMFGSFHNHWEENGFHHDLEVRWSLCRDDVPCTSAPPEPEKNPCEGTSKQDGLQHACEDAERDIIGRMGEKWGAYQRYSGKASSHQSDFLKALGACQGWDAAELAIEALLILDVPSIGLTGEAAEEVEKFKESLELINQLMKAATSGDPLQAFQIGDVKQLQTALEAVNKFFETFPVLNEGEPEKFIEHLDECNAPLSSDLRSSAQTFLTGMQHALDELHDYNKLGNDLRNKQEECLQKQWDAYKACVEDARCNGTSESACDSKKPPGNWPDIP